MPKKEKNGSENPGISKKISKNEKITKNESLGVEKPLKSRHFSFRISLGNSENPGILKWDLEKSHPIATFDSTSYKSKKKRSEYSYNLLESFALN